MGERKSEDPAGDSPAALASAMLRWNDPAEWQRRKVQREHDDKVASMHREADLLEAENRLAAARKGSTKRDKPDAKVIGIRAVAVSTDNPTWTQKRVAKELGVPESTLCGNKIYRKAFPARVKPGTAGIPRGTKRDGHMEGSRDSEDGRRVEGSRDSEDDNEFGSNSVR